MMGVTFSPKPGPVEVRILYHSKQGLKMKDRLTQVQIINMIKDQQKCRHKELAYKAMHRI